MKYLVKRTNKLTNVSELIYTRNFDSINILQKYINKDLNYTNEIIRECNDHERRR